MTTGRPISSGRRAALDRDEERIEIDVDEHLA